MEDPLGKVHLHFLPKSDYVRNPILVRFGVAQEKQVTLMNKHNFIEVCKEETCEEILRRYLPLNNHARSYTWKYNLVPIDMNKVNPFKRGV